MLNLATEGEREVFWGIYFDVVVVYNVYTSHKNICTEIQKCESNYG